MKTFLGSNIKLLRRMKGYTQSQLADIIGVKRNKIASYESGVVEPQFDILLLLAKNLETNISDMLTLRMEDDILETFDQPSSNTASSTAFYSVRPEVKKFIESTNNGQKTIDGFRAMYAFNAANQSDDEERRSALRADLDQLVSLVDSLLQVNWKFIHSIQDQHEEE